MVGVANEADGFFRVVFFLQGFEWTRPVVLQIRTWTYDSIFEYM